MQEGASPTEKLTETQKYQRRLSKRASREQNKGEMLFTLVNNDGNTIRRPKITLALLDPVQLLERQNTNPFRKRQSFVKESSLTLDKHHHHKLVPPDLVQFQTFSEEIVQEIDKYLEVKRNSNKLAPDVCSSPVSRATATVAKRQKSSEQEQIEMKMFLIMRMVQANSQMVKVAGLFMNVKNRPIFVQIVHNTDDDTILLLYIDDFKKFKVKEVQLSGLDHTYYKLLEERAGFNNANIVGNAQTFMTSCEFSVLIEEIVLAHFGQAAVPESENEIAKMSKRQAEETITSSADSVEAAKQAQKLPGETLVGVAKLDRHTDN